MSTLALKWIARAIATACRCPPDRLETRLERSGSLRPQTLQGGLGFLFHGFLIHEAEPAGQLAPEEEIGDRVEVIRQRERLVDRFDAERSRIPRRADFDRLAGEANLAAVGRIDAGEDLDQRGFPGAVVAEQSEHFAFAKIEAHIVDGAHAAKSLHDVAKFDERRHSSRTRRYAISTHTAAIRTRASTILCKGVATPIKIIPLSRLCMMSAPTIAP